MHVRSGYLIGKPKDGKKDAFDARLREIVPRMSELPGIARVRLLWTTMLEPGAPAIYATIETNYPSVATMTAALQTPLRAAIRSDFLAMMADFDGVLTHIESDVPCG